MLDPRIYRTGLVVVALALIVVAFSLGDQQGGVGTTLAPEAFNGADAYAAMAKLAARYPRRPPGSAADRAIADYVAGQFRRDGLAVSSDEFGASTVDGTRTLRTVTGTLAGQAEGSVVVLAGRDALAPPSAAALSATAVLLELAHDLSGETQNRTIVLASTSGTLGQAAAVRLARTAPGPVDAVLVLGDLAGAHVKQPVVVPYANTALTAPTMLRSTVAAALSAQAALPVSGSSLAGQFLHLALPLATTPQAAFLAQQEPSVMLSLAGAQLPPATEPVTQDRITALGRTVLQTVSALSGGTQVTAPSACLLWSGKVVPLWAIRLLVLALMLPVFGATLDGLARARRRGDSVRRWLVWTLAAAAPFALAVLAVPALRATGLIDVAPPAPLPGQALGVHARQVVILALLATLVLAGFALIRPLVISTLADPRAVRHPGGPGASAAVMLVLCLVALAMWLANPFAAALLVPALHLWLWAVGPSTKPPRPVMGALILAGLVLPAAALVYYAHALNLGPATTAWSLVQQLAGGSFPFGLAIEVSLILGCLTSLTLIMARTAPVLPRVEETPVTVRGPVTYAGPGSLGGTESALRR